MVGTWRWWRTGAVRLRGIPEVVPLGGKVGVVCPRVGAWLSWGIDLSADPILLARSAAYAISYDRHSKGE
jgi:hypothetical protein